MADFSHKLKDVQAIDDYTSPNTYAEDEIDLEEVQDRIAILSESIDELDQTKDQATQFKIVSSKISWICHIYNICYRT